MRNAFKCVPSKYRLYIEDQIKQIVVNQLKKEVVIIFAIGSQLTKKDPIYLRRSLWLIFR
jgi:hypothetical protein